MIETKQAVSIRKLQFLCLFVTGLMEVVLIAFGPSHQYVVRPLVDNYLVVPCVFFLGVTFAAPVAQSTRKHLTMGVAMVIWMLIAQNLQYIAGESDRNLGISWGAYLLAFPFASALQDSREEKGLDLFAGFMIAGSSILTLYALLLWADILPAFLASRVIWDGARLEPRWHPNIAGGIYLVGMALTVRAILKSGKLWTKAGLLVLTVLQFISLVLTNSRTTILLVCGYFVAVLFFCFLRKNRKRVFALLLIAVVIFGVFVGAYSLIHAKHEKAMVAEYIAQNPELTSGIPLEDVHLRTYSGQGSLTKDMWTLNGRVNIWRAVINVLRNHPSVRLRGTGAITEMIHAGGYSGDVAHAHSSWFEMALAFGIPGLLLALYFTWLALRDSVLLLFFRDSSIEQKCTVLLVLCLLAAGMLEPFLFVGYAEYQYFNVLFFLCLGYMEQWRDHLNTCQK